MAMTEAGNGSRAIPRRTGMCISIIFYELNRVAVDGGAAGEFVYAISADRGSSFGLRIFVMQAAREVRLVVDEANLKSMLRLLDI